jgi:hypothetical protein
LRNLRSASRRPKEEFLVRRTVEVGEMAIAAEGPIMVAVGSVGYRNHMGLA